MGKQKLMGAEQITLPCLLITIKSNRKRESVYSEKGDWRGVGTFSTSQFLVVEESSRGFLWLKTEL